MDFPHPWRSPRPGWMGPWSPWYARRIISTEDNMGWIRELLNTEHTPKKTPLCFPAPSNVTSVPGFGTELMRDSGSFSLISSTHSPGKNPTWNKNKKRGAILNAAFLRPEQGNQNHVTFSLERACRTLRKAIQHKMACLKVIIIQHLQPKDPENCVRSRERTSTPRTPKSQAYLDRKTSSRSYI